MAPSATPQIEQPSASTEPQRSKREIIVTSIVLGVVTAVVSVVAQRLILGETYMAVSIAITAGIELLYLKTIARKRTKATATVSSEDVRVG